MRKSKCDICNGEIDYKDKLTVKRSKNVSVHIECYKKELLDKFGDEQFVNDKINELVFKRDNKRKRLREGEILSKKEVEDRDKIAKYIMDIYDCTTLPTSFYTKLANINSGKYRGLKEPIIYEDLLIMFKSKQNYLFKLHGDMIKKGKSFKTNLDMVNYDLAVIINKYDSYKKWKDNQKTKSVTKDDLSNIYKNINVVNESNNKQQDNNNSDDINDILEEVF